MGRMVDGAARVRLALAVLVSGALALLVPSLAATYADASSVVMLTAVAALVAAAVVGPGRQRAILVISPLRGPVRGTDEVPPFLAARVTDTTRHPVRPRAPGVV